MAADGPGVQRLRATPVLVAACVTQLIATALFLVNAVQQHTPMLLGWLPVLAATIIAALACRQASDAAGLHPITRRLWRQLASVCVLVALGTVGDMHTMHLHPEAERPQADLVTSALYVLAMLMLLWALLRLPIGDHGRRDQMLRFALDAATVAITAGTFAWYFVARSLRDTAGNPTPTIVLALLGLVASLAFVKVAMSDLGGLDLVTIRLMAAAAAVGAAGGGIFPLLVRLHPGLTGPEIFVPATMLFVAFAADRGRRGAGVPLKRRRGSFSLVPYLAVGATDGLLRQRLRAGRRGGLPHRPGRDPADPCAAGERAPPRGR
jgi:hypothetical protein